MFNMEKVGLGVGFFLFVMGCGGMDFWKYVVVVVGSDGFVVFLVFELLNLFFCLVVGWKMFYFIFWNGELGVVV